MGKRSKGKKRRPVRRTASPGKRLARYSTLELALAGFGALLILLFLGMLISSLL